MPIDSPGLCMGLSLLSFLAAWPLLPNLERLATDAPLIGDALSAWPEGWRILKIAVGAMECAAGACAWVFQARCLQLCHPEYFDPSCGERLRTSRRSAGRGGIEIAGMPVDLDDLKTSVLVTGVTGSSKTAGVLMPALAQLFARHRGEAGGDDSPDGPEKIGAFIPEVKGDLVDGCIYLAHEAGRCVSRDVIVISPSCRIPVVRWTDERGRRWFVSARGGAGGSDAGDLLPSVRYPAGHPRGGRIAAAGIFESPSDVAAVASELSRVPLALGDRRPRFVGWRWEGRKLFRVSHTVARDQVVAWLDSDGAPETADPPATLCFDGVVYCDSGVHYNLVDAGLPAAEIAERLTRISSMTRGGVQRGENDYFYEQGRKVIAACIALHRAVETSPCTAADIVRLATQDCALEAALAALVERIAGSAGAGSDGRASSRLSPLEELARFFRDEWQKMAADGKTANVIRSTISAAFDPFLQDENLADTFCRPSSFSFEDIAQEGKIVALVPGDRYEQLGRMLGTACKLDFQAAMLARGSRSDLNRSRLVLYFADECHKYVTSGSSSAGDPFFMNLSRSNNVANVCATQSYAWIVEVIGRDAANVFLSAFGVQFWLQQTDPETCRRAAEICGKVRRESVKVDHDFDFWGLLAALKRGGGFSIRRRTTEEERERFRPEDFAQLDVGEVIAYNKGRPGKFDKVGKGRAEYHFCTERPAGVAAVNERVREYYRELLENLAHDRGEPDQWSCSGAPTAPVPEREQASTDFSDYRGPETGARERILESAIEEMTGVHPSDLVVAIEEARRRAVASANPPETFGRALGLGGGGLESGGEVLPAAMPVPTEAGESWLPADQVAAARR